MRDVRAFWTSASRSVRADSGLAAPRASLLLSTTSSAGERRCTASSDSTSKRAPAASLHCGARREPSMTQARTAALAASLSSCERSRPEPGTSTSVTALAPPPPRSHRPTVFASDE